MTDAETSCSRRAGRGEAGWARHETLWVLRGWNSLSSSAGADQSICKVGVSSTAELAARTLFSDAPGRRVATHTETPITALIELPAYSDG